MVINQNEKDLLFHLHADSTTWTGSGSYNTGICTAHYRSTAGVSKCEFCCLINFAWFSILPLPHFCDVLLITEWIWHLFPSTFAFYSQYRLTPLIVWLVNLHVAFLWYVIPKFSYFCQEYQLTVCYCFTAYIVFYIYFVYIILLFLSLWCPLVCLGCDWTHWPCLLEWESSLHYH